MSEKDSPIKKLVEKESQVKEETDEELYEVEEPEFDDDIEQDFIVADKQSKKAGQEVSNDVKVAEADERFRGSSRSVRRRQRKEAPESEKALGKKFKKSQKKETRIKKFYSIRNWFKKLFEFDKSNVIVIFIESLFSILDVLLRVIFISGMAIGLYFSLYYINIGDWIMSLVSIVFVLIIAVINDKLM